ncbi:hypothetical protein VVR85_07160 [Corynebacterium sp. LK2590]|uniref:hypothetical protein n=1 Tax=unclassified Corynebacterium TaxID=2624378 RepID=UPI0034D019AD
MRISSLEAYQATISTKLQNPERPAAEPARPVVILDDSAAPVSLASVPGDAIFLSGLPDTWPAEGGRLILVNTPEPLTLDAASRWLSAGHAQAEYWADTKHLARMVGLLRADVPEERACVTGFEAEGGWLRLRLGTASGPTRSSEDFVRGLAAQAGAGPEPEPEPAEPTLSEPSLGSLVVKKVVPLAKPIKQYLPATLVAYLYKGLEKLR